MWPFRRPKPYYGVTQLQVGDDAVCVDDEPHSDTHQRLLTVGRVYRVRDVFVRVNRANGMGGPWIRVDGVFPADDMAWNCCRFRKALPTERRTEIMKQVMEPCGLDVKTEKELAEALFKR